jgi:hypothetical protein
LVDPRGVKEVITVTSRVLVSGVRCQQKNSTPWIAGAHKMDFLSPVLPHSFIRISVQGSGFSIH